MVTRIPSLPHISPINDRPHGLCSGVACRDASLQTPCAVPDHQGHRHTGWADNPRPTPTRGGRVSAGMYPAYVRGIIHVPMGLALHTPQRPPRAACTIPTPAPYHRRTWVAACSDFALRRNPNMQRRRSLVGTAKVRRRYGVFTASDVRAGR